MKSVNVTEALITEYLLDLAQTGRAIPSRVYKHWVDTKTLLDVTLNPEGYTDAKDFAIDYQSVRFLKKFPHLKGSSQVERQGKAIQKFLDCEVECSKANTRFVNLLKTADHLTWTQLCAARTFIHNVLGGFTWDEAERFCNFGPGASIGVKRSKSHVAYKIGNLDPTVTGECHALLRAWIAGVPMIRERQQRYEIVPGSVVTTVPKDASIDRVIAIEPLWNMFFQKGIGGLIRHRLGRIGLDLDTQADRNRQFALAGSIDQSYATVDLSSASDSICLELVRFLLPPDWFAAMSLVRSKTASIKDHGEDVFLRKISSMGNGFTFELETVIFLSLVHAVSPPRMRSVNVDIACFGDDIICRPEAVANLIPLLSYCGFKINREKSFWRGPFRESCGGHYFHGFDVTPFHLDKRLATTHELYWFANSVRLWASRMGGNVYCDALVKGSYDACIAQIPGKLRLPIPPGVGDDGLVTCWDEARPVPYFDKKVGTITGFRYKAFKRLERTVKLTNRSTWLSVKLFTQDRLDRKSPLGLSYFRDWATPTSNVYSTVLRTETLNRCTNEPEGFTLKVQRCVLPGQWGWLGPWV